MASGKTTPYDNDLLKAATGQATSILSTTALAHVYLALYTAAPSAAGGGTECTGGGYARVDTIGKWGTPASGSVSNNAQIQFATSTGAWSSSAAIVAFALLDASSGGNMLYWGTLTDQTQAVTSSNQTIQFAVSQLTLTEAWVALYQIFNGPSPTTAAQAVVTTGNAIKTLLQVEPSATLGLKVVEWGISFDGSAAATPIKCELVETDVAATVTAHVAAGIVKLDADALSGGDPTTNIIQVGTTGTGYTATGEGTITATRVFDAQLVAPTNQYIKQFPLGLEPFLQNSKFTRIRVTAGAAVNAYCYVTVRA